jgi:hypothetical protein
MKDEEKDLAKLKEEDRKLRRFRFRIQTLLNDAVEAFMYAVESDDLKFDRDTEDYIAELFLNERTLAICVEDIKTEKRKPMELLQLARDLAKKTVEIASESKKGVVLKSHVEQTIESLPESKMWPLEIKTK